MKPDDNPITSELPLSPAGEQRRQTILADALRTADGRRRKRTAKRVAFSTASLGVAVLVFTLVTRDRDVPSDTVVERSMQGATTSPVVTIAPDRQTRPQEKPVPTPAAPPVIVQVIREGDVRPKWEVLNDDQFLAALAGAGQPSGLARINGRSVTVPIQ